MGLFKKIFKPVAKVLDKVIPNEIKPALPYIAAFAPFMMPAGFGSGFASGLFKTQAAQQMAARAVLGGGANVLGQLSQEGSEGDINLLSAGIGALSGAMTAPGAADTFRGMTTKGALDPAFTGAQEAANLAERGFLTKATDFGLEGLAKGSEVFAKGIDKPFSTAGLKAATVPAATATGDVMQAQARQLEKQAAIDAALAEAEALADAGLRGDAIRNAMRSYGFFTDDEIESTVSSAGYRAGGRVGFRFGGIDEAIESVQEETVEKGKEGIMTAAKEDPLLVEEYNKYVFDLLEQRPNAKPMSFSDFKRMIMSGMKTGGRVGFDNGGTPVYLDDSLFKDKEYLTLIKDSGLLEDEIKKLIAKEDVPSDSKYATLRELYDKTSDKADKFGKRIDEEVEEKYPNADVGDLDPFDRFPMEVMLIEKILEKQGKTIDDLDEEYGELLEKKGLIEVANKIINDYYSKSEKKADGGLMDLGGKEMDLRGGGFVPIGKKEKADDVPARLSKNEFVMTADAVRAAGGGSVNEGAKRMYKVMNDLEARA